MNKNFRVITINGFRGIIAVVLIIAGLIAGFIISPGWLCMTLWNKAFENASYFSSMSLIQGIILWAIIALTLYALNNKHALIGFGSYTGLNPDQIKSIIERTRTAEAKILKEIKEKQARESIENINNSENIQKEEQEEVGKNL